MAVDYCVANAAPLAPAPGGGRTHNLWLRRPTLYPVELRARTESELATDSADFHKFSGDSRSRLPRRSGAKAGVPPPMLGDFELQKRPIRRKVCARSRAAGDDL